MLYQSSVFASHFLLVVLTILKAYWTVALLNGTSIITKLAVNHFQLEIIPSSKVNFERLATFLLRKSYTLCGGYHYKIEMLQGIEGFDDKRAMPNYIFPSLIANVNCSVEPD